MSAADQATGSSPLTRGKLKRALSKVFIKGLIPAHAGKTPRFISRPPRFRAHPRSRGENKLQEALKANAAGSSPLTRGKRREPGAGHGRRGLIPAHAGKTRPMGYSPQSSRAHPRSRGENGQTSAAYFAAKGSSPLTRGKPFPARLRTSTQRLIPAHAGKTALTIPDHE